MPISTSISKGESWFQQAQAFLGGITATFMSSIPHILVWMGDAGMQLLNSFFLVSVTLDLIKIVWESLALAWAHNINLGKSAELGFNIVKTGLICLMLFGASVLTFAASFALMGLMLGLDPLVNFLKTAYFAVRMFAAEGIERKEFFAEQCIESAKHSVISGIVGAAFIAIIFLPEVIGAAAITAISVIGGGILTAIGAALLYTGISKAVHQVKKWMSSEKREKVNILQHDLSQHIKQEIPCVQDQPVNNPVNNNENENTSWDYYQYAVPIKKKTSDLETDISNHHLAITKEMESSSVFDRWQQKKREDKLNALNVLKNVISQWDGVIEGKLLTLSTHDNSLFYISKPKPKPAANSSKEEKDHFDKQTNRILKLTKNHVLEKYPSAFQSVKYKGKVESLFEETFNALKEKANNLSTKKTDVVSNPQDNEPTIHL